MARGQLGQERVAVRPVVDDRRVPEAQVHRGRPGHPVQRPVDDGDAVSACLVRPGLQVGLVELHDVRPGREKIPDLLVYRLRIAERKFLGAAVELVLRLLRHRERTWHGDLDGPAGVGAQEGHVLHLDRVAPPDRPGHPRHRVRVAAAVQRGARIVDVDAIQRGSEPVGIALPADLAVGHDVQAGQFLGPDGEQGRVPLRLVQIVGRHPPQLGSPDPRREAVPQPLAVDEPIRLRIAANEGGREDHAVTMSDPKRRRSPPRHSSSGPGDRP